jgi:beta-glucosidase
MPPRQLAGFVKLKLAPRKSRRVTIPLTARSFSYWSEAQGGWRVAKGCSQIEVGSSSRDLPLRRGVEIVEGEAPGCHP